MEIVDLDVGAAALDALALTLSENERKRAARFLRDEDRRRFVAARGALRKILGGVIGLAPERVAFVYGPHGKPALSGGDVRFNLSHTAGRALIAWTRGAEIGVDIEAVRPLRFGARIARRYFSEDEQAALAGITDASWEEGFFRCWTRKEAFIKAVGDGLSHPLRTFTVPLDRVVSDEPVRVAGDDRVLWQVSTVDAGPGFLAAIVTER